MNTEHRTRNTQHRTHYKPQTTEATRLEGEKHLHIHRDRAGGLARETLQIDAWQEQKGPARRELTANRLVSITTATLVLWKGDKQKYSLLACRFAIRFDKNLGIASAENEKSEKTAAGGTLALKDLPIHFPVTSLKVAACLKEATVVARISVIDAFHKENTSQPEHEFRKEVLPSRSLTFLWKITHVSMNDTCPLLC